MTLSMLISIFALMAISVPIMHFALKYNVVMINLAVFLESLAGKLSSQGLGSNLVPSSNQLCSVSQP